MLIKATQIVVLCYSGPRKQMWHLIHWIEKPATLPRQSPTHYLAGILPSILSPSTQYILGY